MDLKVFAETLGGHIVAFVFYWLHNHQISPEDWPLTMSVPDWHEQLEMFMEDK
jgi:hypothetical protein